MAKQTKTSTKPKSTSSTASTAKAKTVKRSTTKKAEEAPAPPKKTRLEKVKEAAASRKISATEAKFIKTQASKLLDLRDHILDQMQGVAQDNLRSRPEGSEGSAFGMHQADAGSDAYEKDFALSLLSQEQDALYEVEEAIKRVENNTYGICEMSGKPIPRARLEAIPFARFTLECQEQLEKENRGRRRWDTAPQFMDASESFSDEDGDDDDNKD